MTTSIKVFLYEIKDGNFIPFCYSKKESKNNQGEYEVLDIYEKKFEKIGTPHYTVREGTSYLYNRMVQLLEKQLQKTYINFKIQFTPLFQSSEKSLKKETIDNKHPYHINVLNEKENHYPSNALVIVFTTMEELSLKETYANFTQVPFRKIMRDGVIKNLHPLPLIMIGTKDIMHIYIDKKEEISREQKQEIDTIQVLNLDNRFKIFDSNIWHYYVALNEEFEEKFQFILSDILKKMNQNLYQTNVSLEDLEIQMRMLNNSYIEDFGNGHGKKVTPFKFHSERIVHKKIQALWEGDISENKIGLKQKFERIQWHFLLIDDYAEKPLASNNNNDSKTKFEVINQLLHEIGLTVSKKGNSSNIIITCVQNLEEAKRELMKTNMIYDIVLLDYLLNDTGNTTYGTSLLQEIENESDAFHASVLGNFWVFPISSFSYAMLDAIYERGISHFDKKWFLASGADPINTPEMFKFKLLKFMLAQFNEAGYEEISNQNQQKIRPITVLDYLSNIFKPEASSDIFSLSVRMRKQFPELVKLHSKFEGLLRHKEKSLFAQSMIQNIYLDFSDDMWSHLLRLSYLIAYGSFSQCNQMWDECISLKKKFTEKGLARSHSKSFEKFFGELSNYILALKNI